MGATLLRGIGDASGWLFNLLAQRCPTYLPLTTCGEWLYFQKLKNRDLFRKKISKQIFVCSARKNILV